MPEKHLYEYAVIRVVPCVEREEFLNVGVVLYCASYNFLKVLYALDQQKLSLFSSTLDHVELQERLRSFEHICNGRKHGGTIGQLPIASRFRWLTATRSTVIQTSAVHPGLCTDPQSTLERLHNNLVL
ncbi:MAG TPA: DUF3037 domain-containing protein [Cytophagales bacterium]|nr:DUF3037 domain-containing protein [Cytophagales bacterium]